MKERKIGGLEAFSIGVGGMVGGGIFAVLGLTIDLARGGAPLAFALAGFIALVTTYSYVKLSLRYPSEGGTTEFIVQAFGHGAFSAFINILLVMSYVIMLALYAYAFGGYGAALYGYEDSPWVQKAMAACVIAVFVFINLLGAFLTGKAEDLLVFAKIGILLVFIALGLSTAHWTQISPEKWAPLLNIATGGLIIFLAYEGFELIANAARDVKAPQKTLPRAYYGAVIFVIALYISIAFVAVGNVSFEEAKKAQDYVLAIAAEPFLGHTGFVLIGIAALLSTASAINATLYGGGRTAFLVAKLGEIPEIFEQRIKHGFWGMVILGVMSTLFATTFNINNISIAGSMGFLIIFTLVNLANYRLAKETQSCRWIAGFGFVLTLTATGILVGYNAIHDPSGLISSIIVIATTAGYTLFHFKFRDKRYHLKPFLDHRLKREEVTRLQAQLHQPEAKRPAQ